MEVHFVLARQTEVHMAAQLLVRSPPSFLPSLLQAIFGMVGSPVPPFSRWDLLGGHIELGLACSSEGRNTAFPLRGGSSQGSLDLVWLLVGSPGTLVPW